MASITKAELQRLLNEATATIEVQRTELSVLRADVQRLSAPRQPAKPAYVRPAPEPMPQWMVAAKQAAVAGRTTVLAVRG